MIAVLAEESDHPVVREFFELFKTPWEFHREDCDYDVLICAGGRWMDSSAKLVVIYGSEENTIDHEKKIRIASQRSNTALCSNQHGRIPIYGKSLTFKPIGEPVLADESTREPVALEITSGGKKLVRIGYDLFQEIRHLLTYGQPVANAGIPTLELHIALLRNLITTAAIPLVEIPPLPAGYNFIACLTHDVDHVGVRNHKFDHTMFGFLYRATIGSVVSFFRGRKSARQLVTNWFSALSLPFVHLGFAKDFWFQFSRYLKIENGLASTFFFIPQKGNPGQNANGGQSPKRAASYDVGDLAGELRQLQSAGCEIGVHGIDAWRDSGKGREEFTRIAGLTGKTELGVRMHWLYFDEQSPVTLEAAGFSYDSTIGYNETVGYRAGTTQVFKPLETKNLLELPLHVMDTSLFYPSHLNLSPKEAETVVRDLTDNTAKFGGVLTINWHDRSIAPERLWDGFYINLLDDLKNQGAWFSTAAQTTAWFRSRRSVVFKKVAREDNAFLIDVSLSQADASLPGLRMRVHNFPKADGKFAEIGFNRSGEIKIPAQANS